VTFKQHSVTYEQQGPLYSGPDDDCSQGKSRCAHQSLRGQPDIDQLPEEKDTKVQVYFCDPQALGSGAPTKTLTAFCDSTSLRRSTYLVTLKPISTKSPYN
jgi:hypothetical protein